MLNKKEVIVASTSESSLIPLDDDDDFLIALELECRLETHGNATNVTEWIGCPKIFDSILCWPETNPDSVAVLPCFRKFKGIFYDSTQNATKYCRNDSTWDNSDYEQCLHIANDTELHDFVPSIELPTIIYGVGYILSLSSLTLALIVFLHLKELRCLRNAIHANLFLTYILSGLLWILMLSLQITVQPGVAGCIILVILFHYFSLTNFFWMLVEGLYLYMLVVETFSSDKLKFKMYAILGWVCPAIIIMIWAIVKSVITTELGKYDLGLDQMSEHQLDCTWMHESQIDWIYQGPVSACLLINFIFLLRIMWVLIIKLRSNNNVETKQYRKATKALLVLIPLLGITYLVVITAPVDGFAKYIFAIIRALLISTQGFSISVFYCFMNSEVKQTIRQRFFRWQDERNIQYNQRNANTHQKLINSSSNTTQRSAVDNGRLTDVSPML